MYVPMYNNLYVYVYNTYVYMFVYVCSRVNTKNIKSFYIHIFVENKYPNLTYFNYKWEEGKKQV